MFNGDYMDRIRTRVFSIICCLALAGCVKPTDCNTVDQLKVGTSTVQDANALLGKPSRNLVTNGTSILRWESTTHVYTGGGSSTVIQLTFGPDGKLVDKSCTTVTIPPLVREPAA
jgi:hypothetical protein